MNEASASTVASLTPGDSTTKSGPRTVTETACEALNPSSSRAVTVTVAAPPATGARVTVLPDTPAVTTPVSLEVAS